MALAYQIESSDPRAAGAAWTGGQWSVARMLFGAWLVESFVRLLPWDSRRFELPLGTVTRDHGAVLGVVPNLFRFSVEPRFATAVVVLGAIASFCFLIGLHSRVAAAIVAYFWACIANFSPITPPPGGSWTLVLLAGTLVAPRAPYLSWDARGRADPEGAWRLPLPFFHLAWLLLSLTSVAAVFHRFTTSDWGDGPVQRTLAALFVVVDVAVPFAVWRRRPRRIAWVALVVVRVAAVVLTMGQPLHGESGAAILRDRASLVLLLFAFDPAWLPSDRPKVREHLFFDGTCGLCHRTVRFVAAEDRTAAFYLSPLQGETIRTLLTDEQRAALPDSIVVRTADGRLVVTSDAWVYVLTRLGGLWRVFAIVLHAAPRPLREWLYRVVAGSRRRFFARPQNHCPLLSQRLRTRYLP